MAGTGAVGVIGGNGQLGGAIARAWLRSGRVAPEGLWISSRSGRAEGFGDWPGINFTTSNQELVDACETVLLSVPPHLASGIGISARSRLVMSVMAGVTIAHMAEFTGTDRIVRAMSSSAADIGLAYSPWCPAAGATTDDRETARSLLGACGLTDEVPDEDQINRFTALTGPVPGFVAYYAECMVDHAVRNGIAPELANRAIRQLFAASGKMFEQSETTPAEQVDAMVAYAGTTAAGLLRMQASGIADGIDSGLEAAYRKAQTIASDG